MRVVMCHEFFYLRGGAERYLFGLMELLASYGHEVIPFSMHSSENLSTPYENYFVNNMDFPSLMKSRSLNSAIQATGRSLYSTEAKKKFLKLLQETKPDLVHVFGFAHYLSISILDAAKTAGVPVIQSLLDYKWLCPNTTFLLNGKPCEKCKNHQFYNVVLHRCKRNSLRASLLAGLQAYVVTLTQAAGKVTLFLCHSRYLLTKMIEYGYPPEKFRYIPHFLLDVDSYPDADNSEPYAVYFGRLSYEKGLTTLLRAAEIAKVTVKIIGCGPEEKDLRLYAREHALSNVHFLGERWGQEMQDIVRKARYALCPSEWYENSPLAVYEAMAMGRPVIGANIGGIPELIQDHITGLVFHPGDPEDLAAKMLYLMENPEIARQWGSEARRIAKEKFAPYKHYKDILSVYEDAVRLV